MSYSTTVDPCWGCEHQATGSGANAYHSCGDLKYAVDEQYPHCDARILHAPGECEFCDRHPDWQEFRVQNKISFTGHREKGFLACPADRARKFEVHQAWGGNRPETEETKAERKKWFDKLTEATKQMMEQEDRRILDELKKIQ